MKGIKSREKKIEWVLIWEWNVIWKIGRVWKIVEVGGI